MPKITLKALTFSPHKIAIIDPEGEYSYQQLNDASDHWARRFLYQKPDLKGDRIAYMIQPGFNYVAVQWGIWKAGGVAVPLCISYPLASLAYVLSDIKADQVVIDADFEEILLHYANQNSIKVHSILDEGFQNASLNKVDLPITTSNQPALILYTSGTTSLPKGVVSSHGNLDFQMDCLIDAWEWSQKDQTICVLPLHHIHGIINVISCSLSVGATCEFMPKFNPESVFERLISGELTVFMAVPTIYFKLISLWENFDQTKKNLFHDRLKGLRLMVSGSAALPVSVMEKWYEISGHWLLERYGMTEIGMGLSNPYLGERRPGHVGVALPGVSVRLTNEEGIVETELEPGEIQIKGSNVFQSYWNKPEATLDSFTQDGWFKTGDVAHLDRGYYKILGRNSVDIIKSGGYKLSALEIEEVLRQHAHVDDCGVVGLPDGEWGELVAAVIVLKNAALSSIELNEWLRERLPAYKVPRKYIFVTELPRNAMGKVTKNDLKVMF